MTQKAVSQVEQQFLELHKQCNSQQWNNISFLIELANKTEIKNVALARRIWQRVKNLNPEHHNAAEELSRLTKLLKARHNSQLISSSNESALAHTLKDKLNGFTKAIQTKVNHPKVQKYNKPWIVFLVLPLLVFSFYQTIWASSRFESRAQLTVQQPDGMATMDSSMALLTGLGVDAPTSTDTELVKAYIFSQDMLSYLQKELNLKEHYMSSSADFFSRLHSWSSREDFLNFYESHIMVEIDDKSAVITVNTQGFSPEFSQKLNSTIVNRSEWYINSIGHQLAEEQIRFIANENQLIKQKLQRAKSNLLTFQTENNLLDPDAEGLALQQITYGLESQIAIKAAELRALRTVMTEQAPQVMVFKAEVDALKEQLENERSRLSKQSKQSNTHSNNNTQTITTVSGNTSVSEVLSKYTDYKIALELALQAYTSSQISIEKARVEAYRQLKYLMVVETSTLPEDSQYPASTYNIILFATILLMLFGIIKIIIATIKELN